MRVTNQRKATFAVYFENSRIYFIPLRRSSFITPFNCIAINLTSISPKLVVFSKSIDSGMPFPLSAITRETTYLLKKPIW